MPRSAAWRTPATISLGALSPPMASTAMGSIEGNVWVGSADVDDGAVLVPAAGGAHRVRQLGRGTPRADAARRGGETPRTGTVAVGLHLRLLLLGNSHRR